MRVLTEWIFGEVLNKIWAGMILVGIVIASFSGNISEVSVTFLESSKEAVSLCITMLGIMSLWTGIMRVANRAGIISGLTRLIMPLLRIMFPGISPDHIVYEYIASNMVSNVLGLGWAATPVGLKAMKELKKLNNNSDIASTHMCTFLIVNMSSLQLIPVNIIAYRSQYGSVSPSAILIAAIVATTCSTFAGIAFAIIARRCE